MIVVCCIAAAAPAVHADARHTAIQIGFSLGEEAEDSAGGIIVADADNDHRMDHLITAPGHLVVFANDRGELWRKSLDIGVGGQSESQGLPGHHGPGVAAADVDGDGRTERRGLEVVLLEEGSNHVQLLGLGGVIWRTHYLRQEPQNATLGRFKAGSDETFIWCRSRYSQHQKPFVFDSKGDLASHYEMDSVAPADWTLSGIEVIHRIDWTGAREQLGCAKERHTRGDVCVFEPLTGKFVERFKIQADRLYVADVSGDWREEILVISGDELHIYENTAGNPRPDEPRLWNDRNYGRLKQCYNYYSP